MKARLLTCLGVLLAVWSMPGAAVAVDPGCADLGAAFHTIGFNDWLANPQMWSMYRIEADGDFVYFLDPYTLAGVVDVGDPRHPTVLQQPMWVDGPVVFDYAASFVYVVGDSGLAIFDVHTPSAPRRVGSLALPQQPLSITVSGGRAYVSRSIGEHDVPVLDVIDVADPEAPRLVRSIDGLHGRSARVEGTRLYLLDWNLQIADISDPDQPSLIGTWSAEALGYSGLDFDVAGNHLYLAAAPAELLVLDVTDAANPTLAGSWSAGSEYPASVRSVAIMGSRAIVGGDDALHIVDISDPTAPIELRRCPSMDHNYDIAVDDGRIYVAHGGYWLEVIDPGDFRPVTAEGFTIADAGLADLSPSPDPGLCLAVSGTQLRVLDHTDPQAPTFVATLDLPGEPRRLVTVGNRALVACGTAGLIVVDVADPRAPVLMGAVPGVASAIDLRIAGSLVHGIGDGGPYWVVDTAGVGLPALVGTLPTAIEAAAIAIDGANAYLASWSEVQAIDISNAGVPVSRFVQERGWDWFYPSLVARDGVLHELGFSRMLTLEDMGDSLRVVGQTFRTGSDIAFDGDIAYTTDYAGGASVLDFSDPRHPAYAGNIESVTEWDANSDCITVSGDHVIVGFEFGGLLVAPRVCGTTVPVEVASFAAFRDGDGVRLRWVVRGAAASAQFRVVVRSTGGDRVMPGAVVGDGVFEARDAVGARATGAVTYVLERRDAGGDWLEISSTTYAPAAVMPATRLTGCTPNPFNPNTRVTFTLATAGHVVVAVHDAAGRQVAVLADASFGAGPHALTWNGRDDSGREMASGIYLVSLRSDEGVDRRKVMLVR